LRKHIPATQLAIIIIVILVGALWFISSKPPVKEALDDSTDITSDPSTQELEAEPTEPNTKHSEPEENPVDL
jgi:hypothetical protein